MREVKEKIIQKAYGICLWVTRRERLAHRGDGLAALRCDQMVDRWIEELVDEIRASEE